MTRLDTPAAVCPNTGNPSVFAVAQLRPGGAAQHGESDTAMRVTVEHIVRATGAKERTVRDRFARWRREGGPVERLRTGGRGQPPWSVPLDAYCAHVGLDAELVRAAIDEAA